MHPALRTIGRLIIAVLLMALGFAFAPTARSQSPPIIPGPFLPGLPGLPTVPGPSLPGPLPSGLTQSSTCAWGFNSNQSNIAYPDRNATYFGSFLSIPSGSKLVITGLYPYNRYFSFNAYNAQGQSIGSLTDYQIVPDAGSTNPFAVQANPPDAQRKYTVSVVPNGQAGTNVLPISLTNQSFLFIYRVYVPNQGLGQNAGVPLPTVTLQAANGQSQTIPPCTQPPNTPILSQIFAFLSQFPLPPQVDNRLCQWQGTFGRPGELSANLIPNPDNAYLCAVTQWQPGRVVVIRGQAPTFPNTYTGGSVITTPPTQLRYWSFCTNLVVIPFPVVDCKADYQTALNSQGQYYFAVSTASDQPSNATAQNGVTWLNWGRTDVPGALILRHMLPASSFTQTVKNIPINGTPQQSAQVMGPYYPVMVYCTKTQFESGGPQSCFPSAP